MKQLLLPVLLLTGWSLSAQQNHVFRTGFDRVSSGNKEIVNALLLRQSGRTANKPTGLQQRVIAQASVFDGNVEDTCTFKYSGTRTSRYDHNTLDFSYSYYFKSDYLPGVTDRSEPASMNLLADTISYYYSGGLGSLSAAFYNSNNKADSFATYEYDGTDVYRSKTYNSFNSQHFQNQVVSMNDYSGAMDTSELRRYQYNAAQTQLVSDTSYQQEMGGLAPYNASEYHYNGQGLLDSITTYAENGGYELSQIITISYNSGNLIQNITTYSYDVSLGGLEFVEQDSFGYPAGSTIYNLYQSKYSYVSVGDTSIVQLHKYFNTDNLPDSGQIRYWENGAWENDISLKYTYNSYSNPTVIKGFNADGSLAGQFNFYYETFDDGVGVKDIAEEKNIEVYPNPFNDKINIEWKDEDCRVKLNIINIVGRNVLSETVLLRKGSNQITVPAVAKGMYILQIQDGNGNNWKARLSKL